MKKNLFLALVATVSMSAMVACGGSDDATETEEAEGVEVANDENGVTGGQASENMVINVDETMEPASTSNAFDEMASEYNAALDQAASEYNAALEQAANELKNSYGTSAAAATVKANADAAAEAMKKAMGF